MTGLHELPISSRARRHPGPHPRPADSTINWKSVALRVRCQCSRPACSYAEARSVRMIPRHTPRRAHVDGQLAWVRITVRPREPKRTEEFTPATTSEGDPERPLRFWHYLRGCRCTHRPWSPPLRRASDRQDTLRARPHALRPITGLWQSLARTMPSRPPLRSRSPKSEPPSASCSSLPQCWGRRPCRLCRQPG